MYCNHKKKDFRGSPLSVSILAPAAGLEPATSSLTARRSTTELSRIIVVVVSVIRCFCNDLLNYTVAEALFATFSGYFLWPG